MELIDNPVAEFEDSLVPEQTDVLTASDRCDQCGAQAFFWAMLTVGEAGLLYCNHHWQKNKAVLEPYVIDVVDEVWKLNTKPSQSSV